MKYEYCCKCGCTTGRDGAGDDSLYTEEDGPFCEDCYPEKQAQQRTWVGLTDEELQDIFNEPDLPEFVTESVRAIEAKLKEKNGIAPQAKPENHDFFCADNCTWGGHHPKCTQYKAAPQGSDK